MIPLSCDSSVRDGGQSLRNTFTRAVEANLRLQQSEIVKSSVYLPKLLSFEHEIATVFSC